MTETTNAAYRRGYERAREDAARECDAVYNEASTAGANLMRAGERLDGSIANRKALTASILAAKIRALAPPQEGSS
jgi:hypothetical protein